MFNFRRYCEARLQIAGAAIDTEFLAWLRVLVRETDSISPAEDSAVITGKIEEIIALVDAYKTVKGVV